MRFGNSEIKEISEPEVLVSSYVLRGLGFKVWDLGFRRSFAFLAACWS